MPAWTEDEIEWLKSNYSKFPASKIADRLDRSIQSIYSKVKHLEIQSGSIWQEKEKKYVQENYESTPAKEIAKHLGRTKNAIIRFANQKGLTKMKQRKWIEEEKKFLKKNAQRLSANEISQKLNRTESSVKHFAKRHNISLDKARFVYADKISEGKRQYSFDEDFFARDTPEANYWAGALLADGCVRERGTHSHTIKLHISQKDRSWLEKFKASLRAEHPIREDRDFVRLKIYSDKMFDDLKRFGVVPRKTYKDSVPSLSNKHIHHFIRGLFDGDGSIHEQVRGNVKRVSLTNTENICRWLDEMLCEIIGVSGSLYPHSSSDVAWRWETVKQKYVRKFAEFLYKNANIYMDRKYNRYVEYEILKAGGG